MTHRPARAGDGGTGEPGPARLRAAAAPAASGRQAAAGAAAHAVAELRAWHAAGSHRRDLNRDGVDESNAAVELMDAWWPKLVGAEFRPALGRVAFERLEGMIAIGDHTGGSPQAPDFFDGWWGYVSNDLRTSSARSRARPGAASTAAAARSGAAGRSCGAPCAPRWRPPRRRSTGVATAPAPRTRSRPASTRTARRRPRASRSAPSPSRTAQPSSRSRRRPAVCLVEPGAGGAGGRRPAARPCYLSRSARWAGYALPPDSWGVRGPVFEPNPER